jgi:hypothetical protein
MTGLINQSIPCALVENKATGHVVHRPGLSGAAVAWLLYDGRSVSGRSFGRLETLAALNAHELDDLIVGPARCGQQASDNNEEKSEYFHGDLRNGTVVVRPNRVRIENKARPSNYEIGNGRQITTDLGKKFSKARAEPAKVGKAKAAIDLCHLLLWAGR